MINPDEDDGTQARLVPINVPGPLRRDYEKWDAGSAAVETIIGTALSAVPFVGRLYDGIVGEVHAKRLDDVLVRVMEIVEVLAKRQGLDTDAILGDGTFYDAMFQVVPEAVATDDQIKIDGLISALAHTGSWAVDPALEQKTILRMILRLEGVHIALIKLIVYPEEATAHLDGINEESTLHEILSRTILDGVSNVEAVMNQLFKEISDANILGPRYGTSYQPLAEASREEIRSVAGVGPLGWKVLEYLGNDRQHPDQPTA